MVEFTDVDRSNKELTIDWLVVIWSDYDTVRAGVVAGGIHITAPVGRP